MSNEAKIYKTHILTVLPSTGKKGVIYLVGTTSLTPYVWNGSSFIPFSGGGGSSSGDYNDLDNKPLINEIELVGNRGFNELGIKTISSTELLNILT